MLRVIYGLENLVRFFETWEDSIYFCESLEDAGISYQLWRQSRMFGKAILIRTYGPAPVKSR